MPPRFYLTTAIDYVNSRPHLGTAYEKITADVIARYKRLCGVDTYFMMGNDEHSQNVYKRAVEQGFGNRPIEYCDRMEAEFRSVWSALDLSFDDFIRTTEARHRTAVQKLAQVAYDKGDIYEGVYEGWYCVSCEAFKQEKDLVDGKCPLHPTLTPEWIREKNYFFRLSKYRDALLKHFADHPQSRPGPLTGRHRKTVHQALVERRIVPVRDDILRQPQPLRLFQRHPTHTRRHDHPVDDRNRLLHRQQIGHIKLAHRVSPGIHVPVARAPRP